jgi:hypothetical protein
MLRLAILVALMLASAPWAGRRAPARQADPTLELSTYAAGQSALHRLSFRIDAGDPEIYHAIISYPIGFRFAGFHALGPAGTPIGAYEIDTNLDGAADRTFPLRSVTSGLAYVELLPDDTFDPALEPRVHAAGAEFHVRLPLGGDANSSTFAAPASALVTLVLFQHLLVNPALGGSYTIAARFATVDPDTDGADDGQGAPPQTSRADAIVRIEGPAIVPFAKLRIEDFDLKPHGRHRDRFTLCGIFVPGRASDGIDIETDDVGIAFASFSQTIPADAFRGWRHRREYKGRGPGVQRLEIRHDGRFELDVSDLQLIAPGHWARFTLRIGNDRGEATIFLRRKPWKDGR